MMRMTGSRHKQATAYHVGKYYERLAILTLQNHEYWGNVAKEILPWRDFAARHNLNQKDLGVDLVLITKDNKYYAVQVKYRSDEDSTIELNEISNFLVAAPSLFRHLEVAGYILVTNATLSSNAEVLHKNHVAVVDLAEPQDLSQLEIKSPPPPPELRPYQAEAVEKILTAFNNGVRRGQLIMPPGTGKTLVALRVAEQYKRVLFLAPSIALIDQSARAWLRDARNKEMMEVFAVVSDKTVGQTSDSDLNALSLLSIPATTDASALAEGLIKVPTDKLIAVFCTYQSVEVVKEAQKMLKDFVFDLIVFDEAHRTAVIRRDRSGNAKESFFGLAHHDDNVRAHHRLYMTATPRIWELGQNGNKKGESDISDLVYSMNNVDIYGHTLYTYSFARAVEEGYLADYRIVVFGMPQSILKQLVNYLGSEQALDSSKTLKTIGLMNVLRGKVRELDNTNASIQIKRGIVFHSSIKSSKELAEKFKSLVEEAEKNGLLSTSEFTTEIQHIDGAQSMHERRRKLDWLREEGNNNEHRLLTNAKVLTEGIDVPALDAVVFFDSRESVVDIVQAVGRVMRKAPNKRYGYIIIPVVIKHGENNVAEELEESSYRTLWQVLSGLCSVDTSLPARLRLQFLGITDTEHTTRSKQTSNNHHHAESFSYQYPFLFDIEDKELRKNLIGKLSGKLVQSLGLGRKYLESWTGDVTDVAKHLTLHIRGLLERNETVRTQVGVLLSSLREFLHESVSEDEAIALLVQHALTYPIFDALFERWMSKHKDDVTQALAVLLNQLSEFLKRETDRLNDFYNEMRMRAKGLRDENERADFLRKLYDSFFRRVFSNLADQMGIAYTPIELVDYLVRSADALVQRHFNKRISDEGVLVLEPFAGTGTFLTNLLHYIGEAHGIEALKRKYKSGEIWGNEVLLLPYYIMRANVESAYLALTGEYAPFEGAVFADTFQLAERAYRQQKFSMLSLFPESYAQKLSRQIEKPVNVVLSNPPWRVGAEREGAERKNALYPTLRKRVSETYRKRAQENGLTIAANFKSLYDQYIQALRMASDRLGEEGVIGFVTNNGWLQSMSASGLRVCLAEEFGEVYVYDLRGDARTRGQARKEEGGNPFGQSSRAGVCLVLLVKRPDHKGRGVIRRYTVEDGLSREQKLNLLKQHRDVNGTPWSEVAYEDWIGCTSDAFNAFTPLGKIFELRTIGLKSNRDAYIYNPSRGELERHMRRMIHTYNEHLERIKQGEITRENIDQAVENDESLIKWDRSLKNQLLAKREGTFETSGQIYNVAYRPFVRMAGYVSKLFISEMYQNLSIYPAPNMNNIAICVTGKGVASSFSAWVTREITDLGLLSNAYLYPLYTYKPVEANSQADLFNARKAQGDEQYVPVLNLKENFLQDIASRVGKQPDPMQAFAYLYAILNHPLYRAHFQADVRQTEPRVPLPLDSETFIRLAEAGKRLIELHADYEQQPSWNWEKGQQEGNEVGYPHRVVEGMKLVVRADVDEKTRYTVKKMKLDKESGTLYYNEYVRVVGIPPEFFGWDISGKHALYDVMKYYGEVEEKVRQGKGERIVWDPNKMLEEKRNYRYIADLIGKVVYIAIETQRVHNEIEEFVSCTISGKREVVMYNNHLESNLRR